MNEQQPTNFFDKNTMLAILLSFVVFFGWQQYMEKKYPKAFSDVTENQQAVATETKADAPAEKKQDAQIQKAIISEPIPADAQKVAFSSDKVDFYVSSKGMSILDLRLKEYKRRSGDEIIYPLPIQSLTVNDISSFNIQKTSESEFTGTASINNQKVTVVYKIESDLYRVLTQVKIESAEKKKNRIEVLSQYKVFPFSSSFLLPPTDYQEFFMSSFGKVSRDKVKPQTAFSKTLEQTSIAAFNTQYFAQAFVNQSDLLPTTISKISDETASLLWKYEGVEAAETFAANYYIYFGPKKEDVLKSMDESLVDMIDYGVFSIIGRPMHTALLYIYKLVGNWGLAIILITLLLRTLILPAGVYSFRSMKKMQKIQPKLQAIKEKYKNDAQKANQETLLLLRAEKANPLSGCIPALLQLPIFIAFFTMMSSSFELYMQPFYFWIYDLSSKDPFYVFPILAGAAMFFQMRMTPTTTTDPAQAKIMQFMPILFTVFMLSTPSGLALYMF
ncbi:membrane protein insertase YidC, partial [bacterium]|nr:membrane protein insertase YidC [bacterium]